jgi:hypothetical protein
MSSGRIDANYSHQLYEGWAIERSYIRGVLFVAQELPSTCSVSTQGVRTL